MNSQPFCGQLEALVRARYAAICIATFEEERALDILNSLSRKLNKRLIRWTSSAGFLLNEQRMDQKSVDFKTAVLMAEELAREPTLFVWCDVHPYFKTQPAFVRCFKELCQKLRTGCPSNSVLLAPVEDIPIELQKEVTLLELPLPDKEETHRIISDFAGGFAGKEGLQVDLSPTCLDALSSAGVGLTKSEMENCLSKALVQTKSITAGQVGLILEEKQQIIKKSGILEYIPTDRFSLEQIGGLQNLKRWLEKRRMAFTLEAKAFGVDAPKGVLLVGVPGCGKSLSAKCVAAAWNMPLLKLDMGRIFSGLVGSSEANMRMALRQCEAVSPAILWIDEIEKGLSGVGSGSSDGGTSTRVFGSLLTWMQEKQAPVFVFATANQVNSLPPEFLRKGRFDELFFVDLPSAEERKDIFSIQLRARGRDPKTFDLDGLAEFSGETMLGEGVRLTGSEIESVIEEGVLEAYYERTKTGEADRDLTTQDLRAAISHLVPIARSRHDEIGSLRKWAGENAVRASLNPAAQPFQLTQQTKQEISMGRNIDF